MIIDSHIHAFSEKIAAKAMEKLSATAQMTPETDGTLSHALSVLKEDGVDYGVVLPIATKPTQQPVVNGWAKEIEENNVFCFGSIHPLAPDALDELEKIKASGLHGVKLHPDYQGVYLFDEVMLPIFRKCAELELPVTIHMGHDPVSPLERHACPSDLLYIHAKVPQVKLIGAHLGGMYSWEWVLKFVCGTENIYLDTSFTDGFCSDELKASIIKKHGAEKILFGSDLPWHRPSVEIASVDRLPLSEREKELIFSENATELMKLPL